MRYLIQFADKTTRRISQADAEAIIRALSEKKPVIFKGAYFAPHHIVAVKPITKAWFPEDAAALEEGSDNAARGLLTQAQRVEQENARCIGGANPDVKLPERLSEILKQR